VALAFTVIAPLVVEAVTGGGSGALLGPSGLIALVYVLGYLVPLGAFLGQRNAVSAFLCCCGATCPTPPRAG
jgi:hypothetical protein